MPTRKVKSSIGEMKTSVITIAFAFGFTVSNLIAQPQTVTKGLQQKFPTAKDISWTKGHYSSWRYHSWKAEFILGGRKTSAEFDTLGRWISAHQELDFEEIGVEEVKNAIKKDFNACKITSIKINNWASYGTSYDVEGVCGTEIKRLSYDYKGWPWPPKIT
jgi:Tfp pilus assembly protein PilX